MDHKTIAHTDIPLINVKGAFSEVLAEWVALGVLYHTKNLEQFMQFKREIKWEKRYVNVVSRKHIAIVGYGNIGAACARLMK